jgi:hypothetical protein
MGAKNIMEREGSEMCLKGMVKKNNRKTAVKETERGGGKRKIFI